MFEKSYGDQKLFALIWFGRISHPEICTRVLGHDYETALWGDLMGRESTGLAELPMGGEGARTPEKVDSPNKIAMFLVTSIHVLILIF